MNKHTNRIPWIAASLILIFALSACAGRWTRGQGRITNSPGQNQAEQNQPANQPVSVEQQSPVVESPVVGASSSMEQSLEDLDQSLRNTDTLNELDSSLNAGPQPDQTVEDLNNHLDDLQNTLNSLDRLEDIK